MNLALEATTSKGVRLIAVGYKYNYSKVLCFVATKNAGSTIAGDPYRACFLDDHDNLVSRPVDCPELISKYFQWSNGIDKHNQARQFELCLEKHWRTQNACFHLVTSVIGICVTDARKGYRYAFCGNSEEDISIQDFVDRLAYELIHNNLQSDKSLNSVRILSPLLQSPRRRSPRFVREETIVVEVTETTISPLTKSTSSKVQYDLMWAKMMELHQHVQQDSTETTGRKIRRHFAFCKLKTGWFCKTCKVYCCPDMKGGKQPRNCYKEHILQAYPSFKV
jgi:hypothetical protein